MEALRCNKLQLAQLQVQYIRLVYGLDRDHAQKNLKILVNELITKYLYKTKGKDLLPLIRPALDAITSFPSRSTAFLVLTSSLEFLYVYKTTRAVLEVVSAALQKALAVIFSTDSNHLAKVVAPEVFSTLRACLHVAKDRLTTAAVHAVIDACVLVIKADLPTPTTGNNRGAAHKKGALDIIATLASSSSARLSEYATHNPDKIKNLVDEIEKHVDDPVLKSSVLKLLDAFPFQNDGNTDRQDTDSIPTSIHDYDIDELDVLNGIESPVIDVDIQEFLRGSIDIQSHKHGIALKECSDESATPHFTIDSSQREGRNVCADINNVLSIQHRALLKRALDDCVGLSATLDQLTVDDIEQVLKRCLDLHCEDLYEVYGSKAEAELRCRASHGSAGIEQTVLHRLESQVHAAVAEDQARFMDSVLPLLADILASMNNPGGSSIQQVLQCVA